VWVHNYNKMCHGGKKHFAKSARKNLPSGKKSNHEKFDIPFIKQCGKFLLCTLNHMYIP